MEFKSLKNIESNFRLIRICCALFAGLCAAVAVASVGFSYAFAERQRQKIYVLAGGISQTVRIDSIRCNFDSYPYQVTTYARQRIMRESTITERSLVTTCRLINAVRSDNNPQGFLLENLNVIENKDLATYDR